MFHIKVILVNPLIPADMFQELKRGPLVEKQLLISRGIIYWQDWHKAQRHQHQPLLLQEEFFRIFENVCQKLQWSSRPSDDPPGAPLCVSLKL